MNLQAQLPKQQKTLQIPRVILTPSLGSRCHVMGFRSRTDDIFATSPALILQSQPSPLILEARSSRRKPLKTISPQVDIVFSGQSLGLQCPQACQVSYKLAANSSALAFFSIKDIIPSNLWQILMRLPWEWGEGDINAFNFFKI